MPRNDPSPLALALGRVPSGLYIVTTHDAGAPVGFVGSLVMQVGFEPPTLIVAVAKDRSHLAAIRASGCFAVSVLDKRSRPLVGRFLKGADGSPFAGLATRPTRAGSIVLADALAWLDCRVVGERDSGDHVVVFGEIVEGGLAREGEPHVHLRKNGLAY